MAINQQIYKRLGEVAANRKLITYGEVAALANLNMGSSDDRNKLNQILVDISKHEHKQGRPLLSAVVILPVLGYPNAEFFSLCRELRLLHSTKIDTCLDFFTQEVERVYACWKK